MDAEDFGQVLAAVREFIRKEVVPRETWIDENDEIPAEIREKAAGLGLFGWALPEEFGGLGRVSQFRSRSSRPGGP
jgi:acyl-CoA dehydrogenase